MPKRLSTSLSIQLFLSEYLFSILNKSHSLLIARLNYTWKLLRMTICTSERQPSNTSASSEPQYSHWQIKEILAFLLQ
jgi:hypothetical protein